jgi:hypothetical protein
MVDNEDVKWLKKYLNGWKHDTHIGDTFVPSYGPQMHCLTIVGSP